MTKAQVMDVCIKFTGKHGVEVESKEPLPPGPGAVRVRTICSLMSTGTENIVFNRQFAAETHWDHWVRYPFYPGYAAIGRVESVGDGVETVRPGQVIAARSPHASAFVCPADHVYAVPEGLDPRQAVWFALAKIAGAGALRAGYEIGDRVLVIGAGPIGQMSVRWAAARGAETVIAVDAVASRLELARRGGATAVIAQPIAEATDAVLAANDGAQPRVVIDSTGNAEVFAAALRIVADHGTVVVLGDTGTPTEQRLTGDVINRGLHIVGAHDRHTWPGHDEAGICRLFFRMLMSGRINLDGLNTHTFPGADAPRAYELANTRRGETMGILFDWA